MEFIEILKMEEYKQFLDRSIRDIKLDDRYKSFTKEELSSLKDAELNVPKPKGNRTTLLREIDSKIKQFDRQMTKKSSSKIQVVESDIDLFYESQSKNCNDESNKKREHIIKQLSQGNPYPNNDKWAILSEQFTIYLNKLKDLIGEKSHQIVHKHSIKIKGGRGYHYDFLITFYNASNNSLGEYKIEFKNNACNINDCPQYVSPMKGSQYFDCNQTYEDMFYSEFLPLIGLFIGRPIPDKDLYMKQIHGNKPECMAQFQETYYKGSKQSSKFTGLDEDIDNYNFMTIQSWIF
jgi:hypothetical protein